MQVAAEVATTTRLMLGQKVIASAEVALTDLSFDWQFALLPNLSPHIKPTRIIFNKTMMIT